MTARRLLVSFLLLAILCGALVYILHNRLHAWGERSISLSQPKVIDLKPGVSLQELSTRLENQSITDSAWKFRYWTKLFSAYHRFQAGMYKFEGAVSPSAIAQKMMTGDIFVPVVLQFTIPEGFTQAQIIDMLAERYVASRAILLRESRSSTLLKRFAIPGESLEGYLYPATYQFSKMPSAEEVLATLVETFYSKLPDDYRDQVEAKGLSLHEAVIFASLIERETAMDEERSQVSEVIWNRLNAGIPLGIDAALIYGIEDYDGNIRFRHLRDTNNPYNLRVHAGLPPSPICSPSMASLKAVLTPTEHGYYYYVADPERAGFHRFTKTLREHNRNVRELVNSGK